LASILPDDTSTLIKSEPLTEHLVGEDYVPTPSEIEQQLIIEQRIMEEKMNLSEK
jgi:hypothetical protein